MSPSLLEAIAWGVGMGLLGAVVFSLIGLVSGTDETATIAPITLLVILVGVPPTGVFTFFMAAIISKHITHAIPTTLLGIPGDTTAVPMLRDAQMLRELGVPHIALRKAISGGVISAFIAVPAAVLFAQLAEPVRRQHQRRRTMVVRGGSAAHRGNVEGPDGGRGSADPVRLPHRGTAGVRRQCLRQAPVDQLLPWASRPDRSSSIWC
ncbi:tripartite tricarboxylate transporter permease [Aeromicrobium sp. UC242_57]|uniref:tripartite tricarboxylate transporter permease n=1 Tax=Aeromicrobium sp. UC242_57 TaxID=3374624 RepID=UPI003787836A